MFTSKDAQWTDIDYMRGHLDWTYDQKSFARLPDVVRFLHAANMHFVPIVDPGISNEKPAGSYPPYDRGLDMNVFVRDFFGKPLVGKVRVPFVPHVHRPILLHFLLDFFSSS